MKLDSEEQRTRLISLLVQVPVKTTLGDVLAGTVNLPPDIPELVMAIQKAPIEDKNDG